MKLTRQQKEQVVRLDAMGMKPRHMAAIMQVRACQIGSYLHDIRNPQRPGPIVIDKPRCPPHLKALAAKWRAKHGDVLVVRA